MKIASRTIGPNCPPYIIAEISANHGQSIKTVFSLLEKARSAGVDAVKIQSYTADSITFESSKAPFMIEDKDSLWHGRSLFDLYSEGSMPYEWYDEIFGAAKDMGLTLFSSPFDEKAVEILERYDAPAYKVASPEINHIPLIKCIAQTGKPVIISTGMADKEDIDLAVQTLSNVGNKQMCLLQCTSAYPTKYEDCNLGAIPVLKTIYDCEVGLSDHTLGIIAPVAAVALGATIIEKHFTLSRSDGGLDAAFSLEPDELRELVEQSKSAWLATSGSTLGVCEAEKISEKYRRSVFAVRDISAGETFTADNLKIIRPGHGIAPKYFDSLLGKGAASDIRAGSPLTWSMVA